MDSSSPHSAHSLKPKNFFLFAVLSFISFLLYFFIKYGGPVLVRYLFDQGRFELLNRFADSTARETLPYYLGRWQETVWGPLSQLISGLLFAAIGLRCFKRLPLVPFAFAVFLYLVITKFEVLFFPPYGDAVGGPFAEAIWLARHSFDYVRLFKEPGYIIGGPKVYMFSIYPTVIAVMLKVIPSVKAFLVVSHAAVFGMVAVMTAMLRGVTRKVFGDDTALLTGCLLLFLPLFQSQTEAINMEIPCAFFVVCAAYGLIQRRVHFAGVMTVAAILVKGTAVFAAIAFFLTALIQLFLNRPGDRKDRVKILCWAVGLIALSALKVSSKFFINDQHVSQGMVKLAVGWDSLNRIYISYLFVISLILLAGCFLKKRFTRRGGEVAPEFSSIFFEGNGWIMIVFAMSWFILFFNFFAVSPRYRVLAYPFILFSVVSGGYCWIRNASFRRRGLIAVTAVALFSSYGFFYQPITENDHVMLERSLEYRNDLEAHRRMARHMEENYESYLIGAPFIVAQLLALPELGYVNKKLNIMIYGFDCYYGGIKMFQGIKELDISKTVYVGIKQAPINAYIPYPVNPRDHVLETIQSGNKNLTLFMGGISLESMMQGARFYKLKMLQEKMQEERRNRNYDQYRQSGL